MTSVVDTGQGITDWHYVWWSTISVLTPDKIKMMEKIKLTAGNQYGGLQSCSSHTRQYKISLENYNISTDTEQDKPEWQ